jgi:5'-3' exonuclease
LPATQNLQVELKMAGVTVFGNPAKKESLVLVLPDVRSTLATDAAASLLRSMLCGRVYVKWPYLQEAEVGCAAGCALARHCCVKATNLLCQKAWLDP